MAEAMGGSAALHELMGHTETLAESLGQLVELFLGRTPKDATGGLSMLTHHFAKDDLAEARTAVADRIVAEFKSTKRLVPDFLVEELKSLRSMANKVVTGVGKYLSHEDLVAAFTLRSKRLVTQEILSSHIDGALPDEKVERLLFVEENVIGSETSGNWRDLSCRWSIPRLSRIFSPTPRRRSWAGCSGWPSCRARCAAPISSKSSARKSPPRWTGSRLPPPPAPNCFESIEGRANSHVDKATTLLKLALNGVFTEGALAAKAREMILGYLATPGFLAGYFAAQPQTGDSDAAMTALMADLGKAGITAETGLKSIAA